MRIETVDRTYLLTYWSTGETFPVEREDVDRLLAELPLVAVGHMYAVLLSDEGNITLRAATTGFVPFIIYREENV